MLIERNNNEVVIRITSSAPTSDIQQLVDYLQYIEIARKSKAKKPDLDKLLISVKKKRQTKVTSDLR